MEENYFNIKQNHLNSFDDYFSNYQTNTRLYTTPLVCTKKAWSSIMSPILWNDETNGFLFQNDRIITNTNNPLDNIGNRNLTLVRSSRFYSVYREDEWVGYYIFFSKFATKALLEYHSYPFTDEVVGAVTLYINHKTFLGNTNESMTLLISNKPTGNKYACWNLEDYHYCERYNNIFKNIGTRYLLMSLIFKLQQQFEYSPYYVWEKPDIDQQIIKCIKTQYNNLQDEYKDLCHIILPEEYKYIHNTPYSSTITKQIVTKYINNIYCSTCKKRIAGQLGSIRMRFDDNEEKLIEKTYSYIFGMPHITLSQENEDIMIRNSIVLYLINRAFSSVRRAVGVSSLWLYYNLYYLRKKTTNEEIYKLANILIQCVLYTNKRDFIPILSRIKDIEFSFEKPSRIPIFGLTFGIKTKTSWHSVDEEFCLNELLFYFNENITDSQKYDLEQSILGKIPNMSDGYNFDVIYSHLKNNFQHSKMGIEKEREFYANKLYDYIEEQIKIDPYFGYE